MRHVILVKRDSAEAADVLTAVRKTAAAGVCHLVAAHGTFIAGNVYDLDDIGVAFVAAHGDFDTLGEYCTLLVDTAAHSRRFARHDYFWNINCRFGQAIGPGLSRYLPQYLVF